MEPKDLAARFAENPDSTGAATLFTFFALFTFFYGTFAKMLLRDDREPGEGGAVSSGRWTAALLAGALCIGATAATSQEMDGESFAALAYLRVPFSSNPYLGVMVEKDRIEASRAQARSYEPLWLRPKVIDVHLSAKTLEPLRINGREVYGSTRSDPETNDTGWAPRIE